MDTDRIKRLATGLIEALGEDPAREGLVDTPARMARAWAEMFQGYAYSQEDLVAALKTFDVSLGHGGAGQDLVWIEEIPFYSTCEHHLLPFHGTATVAYLPNGRVIGLSKVPRVVRLLAHRLQVQERLTRQICDVLAAKTRGVAVGLRATHLCLAARGQCARETTMRTVAYGGACREPAMVQRFEARW